MFDFVCSPNCSLKTVCSHINEGIRAACQRNKARYDQKHNCHYIHYWGPSMFVRSSSKTGQTWKLPFPWHATNTVVDKLSLVNYRIQLQGVPNRTFFIIIAWSIIVLVCQHHHLFTNTLTSGCLLLFGCIKKPNFTSCRFHYFLTRNFCQNQ